MTSLIGGELFSGPRLESFSGVVSQRLLLVSLEVILLAGLVWGLIRLFRLKSPRLKAFLWLLVIVKPLFGLVIGTPVPVHQFQAPAVLDEPTSLDFLLARQLARDRFALWQDSEGAMPASPQGAAPLAERPPSSGLALAPKPPAQAPWGRPSWGQIAFSLWLVGCLLMGVRMLRDRRRLRGLIRESQAPPPSLQRQYQQLAEQLRLRRRPALRISDGFESPALVGYFFPTILLPGWMASDAGPKTEWAMRHELRHHRNRDPWFLALRQLSRVLFFFHPVVHWAGHRWEEEAELACDRALIEQETQARDYARQLYSILEGIQMKRQVSFSNGLFATRTQIGKRIAALVTDPLSRPARLGVLAVTGLAILAAISLTCGGIFAQSPASSLTDEEIAEKVSQAKVDLRNVHTALECHFVDYDEYPLRLESLTTPIAYLTTVPEDPFAEGRIVQWGFSQPDEDLLLWTVGPDGVDDRGSVNYDPTNGTVSSGDIVRVVFDTCPEDFLGALRYYTLYPFFRSSAEKQRLHTVVKDLELLGHLLLAYHQKNCELPEQLTDLLTLEDLVKSLPLDPYGTGQSYGFKVLEGTTGAVVYSVGPDGKDDGGEKLHALGSSKPLGDIVCTPVQLSDSGPDSAVSQDSLLAELLKMKDESGRDNAMINYQQASLLKAPLPEREPLESTLKKGWSEESRELLPLFGLYEPRFELIRKGVAQDYAIMPDPREKGCSTPIPNFLFAQVTSKLLCAQGLYYESEDKHGEALDNYLTVLLMGRDYGAENALLIGGLISCAVENIAVRPLQALAASGNLTSEQLGRAAETLRRVEKTNQSVIPFIDDELNIAIAELEKFLTPEDPTAANTRLMLKEMTGFTEDEINKLLKDPEAFLSPMKAFLEESLVEFSIPIWDRDREAWEVKVERLSEQNRIAGAMIPNFVKAEAQFTIRDARIRLARVTVALEEYRNATGAYPGSLLALVPRYLPENPLDPFSGKLLPYSPTREGYQLYSVGPDGTDQSGAVQYDPTNGTLSSGDISF